jgi:hypothetical protein
LYQSEFSVLTWVFFLVVLQNISDRGLSRAGSRYGASSAAASTPASVASDSRPASRASENGEVDYKKVRFVEHRLNFYFYQSRTSKVLHYERPNTT